MFFIEIIINSFAMIVVGRSARTDSLPAGQEESNLINSKIVTIPIFLSLSLSLATEQLARLLELLVVNHEPTAPVKSISHHLNIC